MWKAGHSSKARRVNTVRHASLVWTTVAHIGKVVSMVAAVLGVYSFAKQYVAPSPYSLSLQVLPSKASACQHALSASSSPTSHRKQKPLPCYETLLVLSNNGSFGIIESDIVSKLRISVERDNKIYGITSASNVTRCFNNSVCVSWDLLNPNQFIDIKISSSKKLSDVKVSSRIKNVQSVGVIYVKSRTSTSFNAYHRVSIWWYVVALLSIVFMLDALNLAIADIVLTRLINYPIKVLRHEGVARTRFINNLCRLYAFYRSKVWITLADVGVFREIVDKDLVAGRTLGIADADGASRIVANIAMHSNMYSMRTSAIFWVPVILIVFIARVLINIVWSI